MQRLYCFGFLFSRLLIRRKLSVAPAFVLSLFVGFFKELSNQVFDELFYFLKRISFSASCKCRQDTTVYLACLLTQVLCDSFLCWAMAFSSQLSKRALFLQEC